MSSTAADVNQHIVVVDDDPVTAKVARFLLEDEGYDTTVLYRGSSVVDTVTGQETDLVLLDVNLPDIDGFTLTKLLRARRYFDLAGKVLPLSADDQTLARVCDDRLRPLADQIALFGDDEGPEERPDDGAKAG